MFYTDPEKSLTSQVKKKKLSAWFRGVLQPAESNSVVSGQRGVRLSGVKHNAEWCHATADCYEAFSFLDFSVCGVIFNNWKHPTTDSHMKTILPFCPYILLCDQA